MDPVIKSLLESFRADVLETVKGALEEAFKGGTRKPLSAQHRAAISAALSGRHTKGGSAPSSMRSTSLNMLSKEMHGKVAKKKGKRVKSQGTTAADGKALSDAMRARQKDPKYRKRMSGGNPQFDKAPPSTHQFS